MGICKWLPAAAALVLAGASGCARSGTVVGGGELNRSVRFIGVPAQVEVLNVPDLVKRGAVTYVDVTLRNNDAKLKQWALEYSFQFFDLDGRELASAVKGWQPLTIGRGETKTIGGSCLLEGAATATLTIRKWDRKN
jgi:hypothetical protein